jgi:hypothetical protein
MVDYLDTVQINPGIRSCRADLLFTADDRYLCDLVAGAGFGGLDGPEGLRPREG